MESIASDAALKATDAQPATTQSQQLATVLPDTHRRVCVVGLGYIGLPTASMLAGRGCQVHGVDICSEIVEVINSGRIHIREPDLDIAVKSAVDLGRLQASVTPAPAEVFILAVPTPFKDGNEPDLSYVEAASRSIAPMVKRNDLVILESTSPVGTTEKVAAWLAEERPDLATADKHQTNPLDGVHVAHCPERVLPGQVMRELVENDRTVGGIDSASTQAAADFYRTFVKGEVLETDARTAEMSKLAENSFRDINIAYANELSMICDKLGIDVWKLIDLANHHPRVNILQPGAGVGGHCIAVDPWFIVSQAPEQARLIRTAREVNNEKPRWVINQVKQAVADHLIANPDKVVRDVTIAGYGLAFKPNIDDLRESPALRIAERLADLHPGTTLVVEPHIESLPARCKGRLSLVDLQEAHQRADIAVLLVDHDVFKSARPHNMAIVDTRGIW